MLQRIYGGEKGFSWINASLSFKYFKSKSLESLKMADMEEVVGAVVAALEALPQAAAAAGGTNAFSSTFAPPPAVSESAPPAHSVHSATGEALLAAVAVARARREEDGEAMEAALQAWQEKAPLFAQGARKLIEATMGEAAAVEEAETPKPTRLERSMMLVLENREVYMEKIAKFNHSEALVMPPLDKARERAAKVYENREVMVTTRIRPMLQADGEDGVFSVAPRPTPKHGGVAR